MFYNNQRVRNVENLVLHGDAHATVIKFLIVLQVSEFCTVLLRKKNYKLNKKIVSYARVKILILKCLKKQTNKS
jgi:hypothetical protein